LFSRLKWTATQTTNTSASAPSAKAAEFTFRKKNVASDADSKTQPSGVLIKMPGAESTNQKAERTSAVWISHFQLHSPNQQNLRPGVFWPILKDVPA
jgi:hypothetical protein